MPRNPRRKWRKRHRRQQAQSTSIQNTPPIDEQRLEVEACTKRMPVLRDICAVPFVRLTSDSNLLQEVPSDSHGGDVSMKRFEDHFQLAVRNINSLFYHESVRIISSGISHRRTAPSAWTPTSDELDQTWTNLLNDGQPTWAEEGSWSRPPLLSEGPADTSEDWIIKNLLLLLQGYIRERQGYSLLIKGRRAQLVAASKEQRGW